MTLSEIAQKVQPGQWFRREGWRFVEVKFAEISRRLIFSDEYGGIDCILTQEGVAATDWVICDEQEGGNGN